MESQQIVINKNIKQNSVILPYSREDEFYVEDLGELVEKKSYIFLKRFFDIVLSVVLVVFLIIPAAIIALLIKISTKGKIFYFQERLGKNGRKFNIIKFRTMKEDAEYNGAQWCIDEEDKRVTPIGKILRKYHLDEIPQLLCILEGSMSFVGPRPERECFYIEFEKYIHGFSQRLKVKPGLTGFAQIQRNFKIRPEEKIEFDIEYIKTRSLINDSIIILKTVWVVIKKLINY